MYFLTLKSQKNQHYTKSNNKQKTLIIFNIQHIHYQYPRVSLCNESRKSDISYNSGSKTAPHRSKRSSIRMDKRYEQQKLTQSPPLSAEQTDAPTDGQRPRRSTDSGDGI